MLYLKARYFDMKPKTLIEKRLDQIVSWDDVVISVPDEPTFAASAPTYDSSFVERTISDLRKTFASHDHKPSPQMWSAIKDIARTIGEIISDQSQLTPTFYVSALDPGVGKTQTIVHAIRNLPKDVGVIICLSRINEVNTLVKDMRLHTSEFAVLVGKNNGDRIDDFGNKNINDARVLFTTQQKVDEYLKSVSMFSDLSDLYFRGKPRVIRIWDESLLPGKEITLNIHEIASCQEIVANESVALADAISDMHAAIRQVDDGAIYHVPDLSHHTNAFKLLKIRTGAKAKDGLDYEAVDALQSLSGKAVRVRRDHKGNTVLDYTESLPDDFAPVIILDASARVRKTYELWRSKRGNLLHLQDASKQYRDLTIHHWNKGGGRWAFNDAERRAELLDGIASAINSKPTEDWLVIVHKKNANFDLESLVRDLVTNKAQKIRFLTWGNHHATNQYVNVKNVILAGTMFYNQSTYEVRARAAGGMKTDDHLPSKDLETVTIGEHAHLVLQALCRGSVRRCVGDSCAPMDAYVIAHNGSGIPGALPDIFPGCKIKPWNPVDKPLQGKLGEALSYLRERFADDPGGAVSFADVMKRLGMSDRSNFKKMIRDDERFQRELKKMDAYESALGDRQRYNNHFERAKGMCDSLERWADEGDLRCK